MRRVNLDLYADLVCPWCFIGKRRLEQAMASRPEIDLQIRWRAFQLNSDMPADGMLRKNYLAAKFGNRYRSDKIYEHVRRIGKTLGIAFEFDRIQRMPNTVNAHRLVRLADDYGQASHIVETLFAAYFLHGLDIGNIDVLVTLGADAGLDKKETESYLRSNEDKADVREEDLHARQLGIQGVPCFMFDNQYILSGAQEPATFYPLFDLVRLQPADAVISQ